MRWRQPRDNGLQKIFLHQIGPALHLLAFGHVNDDALDRKRAKLRRLALRSGMPHCK